VTAVRRPKGYATIAIQIGEQLKSSELIPLGRYCTVHAVIPLPNNNNVAPVTSARSRSVRPTRAFPRSAAMAKRSAPAIRNRKAAIANGGIVCTAARIPANVEPHSSHTAAIASGSSGSMRARESLGAIPTRGAGETSTGGSAILRATPEETCRRELLVATHC
jgi:hypothetical protein